MLKLVSTNDEFYLIASVATYVHFSLPGFLIAKNTLMEMTNIVKCV